MRLRLLLGGAVFLLGCSSTAPPPTVTDSVAQETWRVRTDSESKYLVLVVDDSPSEEAEHLRAAVVEAFRDRANHLQHASWEQWQPVRWHVIVVRPSGDGAHAMVGPATDARLAWIEDDASPEGVARVIDGIEAALAETNSDPRRPYLPIEAEEDALALLKQMRAPRSAEERAITEMISADPGEIQPFMAATPHGDRRPIAGPSTPPWELEGLDFHDGWMICEPARSASCEIMVRTPDLWPCPADRGWLDPRDHDGVRRPRIERSDDDGSAKRVCEVAPFTGEMLARCQDGRACEGSGWCLSNRASGCPTPNFRFVGGAVSARDVTYGFTCNLNPF